LTRANSWGGGRKSLYNSSIDRARAYKGNEKPLFKRTEKGRELITKEDKLLNTLLKKGGKGKATGTKEKSLLKSIQIKNYKIHEKWRN